ncbi:DUF3500 domain-containing protein [Microbacterium sp. RG1]|uniref:DUF3500 domain-containing protein n=1 Tax=Microbacterium sp. RG1 TaxID=2489212 RepID=UPI0010CA3EBD|nr:DUF3500 domain-containing protein [Microbacterium sp. RG1]
MVAAADAFTATLDSSQQAEVLLDFDSANATAWSNLPCGAQCRVGITFSSLSDTQLAAAKAVLQAALGTSSDTGYQQAMQILLADDELNSLQSSGNGGGGPGGAYSAGNYYFAILGEPSETGTWQLHFGGHHLAVNITYVDGVVAGTTPFFIGVEPTSWTADDGTSYAPLTVMKDAMSAAINSLDSSQLAAAKLSQSYTDVLLGPGTDGDFPTTKSGVRVGDLSADQQKLVLAAMYPWVAIADDATAEDLMATYSSELADTYLSYSGSTDLTAQGDYVRIDGPSVWIEFVCQNGVVVQNQIHYHTVYRDHTRDYGGQLSF